MNTYHDRYARFGVIIGILVGVAVIAIIGLVSSCQTYPGWRGQERLERERNYPVVQPMDTYELSETGYIGQGNESQDWCDQFINFSHDDIEVSGQVSGTRIEIFIRDTETGVMARIAGDNVSSLEMKVK